MLNKRRYTSGIVQHVHSHSSQHIQLFQDRDTTRLAMQTTVPLDPTEGLSSPGPVSAESQAFLILICGVLIVSIDSPVQSWPLPVKPSLHVHLTPPSVLMQLASGLHPPLSSLHLSISV